MWDETCHDEPAAINENRRSTRFRKEPDTDYAVIWQVPGEEILASVCNESLGGIAVTLQEVATFQVGQEADIIYAGSLMRGIVRHIEPQSDGTFLVGFQCRCTL